MAQSYNEHILGQKSKSKKTRTKKKVKKSKKLVKHKSIKKKQEPSEQSIVEVKKVGPISDADEDNMLEKITSDLIDK